MPATGYSWRQTKELNKQIWSNYQNHQLGKIRIDLNESHLKLQEIIAKHTDQELFEKKRYKWTGSSSLST